MPEKIGVYIDQSAIQPYLKAEALAEYVTNALGGKCPVVKTAERLTSEAGLAMIKEDIDAGNVDGVVICGSSPRHDWDLFNFEGVLVERVNLREQCVLCYQNPDGSAPVPGEEAPELLVKMAQDYIRMGVTKLQKTRVPEPDEIEANKTIMVLGAGFTGLNAALYAARCGQDVLLVEKSGELGGYAAKLRQTVPFKYPHAEAHDTGVEELIKEVEASDRITVLKSATLEKISGAPAMYTAVINGEEYAIGAVVLATGWVPGKTKYLAPLGYGSIKNVITTDEFEAMAKEGKIARPSDGATPASVAFILDVDKVMKGVSYDASETCEPVEELPAEDAEGEEGEADTYEKMESAKHVKYSSEVSSLVALKQANYVCDLAPDSAAFIFYDHMMVPGINERYYKAAQDRTGIMLSKATITEIKEAGNGSVSIVAKDTLLGENVEVVADLVVLPTAMVPVTALEPIVNLQYRQGPHFPDLDLFDGFADSNYICFPYETRRTGIYAAGAVRQPMGLGLAREDAAGAVLKAIQCVNSADRGVAVHPRSGDRSYPVFNFMRCTQCKRCTEECPFGALDDDEKGTPKPNPTRCRRCGTCMGACPERVISFDNYNIDQIGSTIKEVEVPDDMATGGPRIIVLACENDAYPALDMAAMRGERWSPYVRFVPVRCLGSINAIWVADAMGKGIDGVLLMGCKYGEDYQCHFVKGSELCSRRAENIAETLQRLGVEPERVEQVEVAIDDYDKVPGIIGKFVDYVLKIGPNPFKGY